MAEEVTEMWSRMRKWTRVLLQARREHSQNWKWQTFKIAKGDYVTTRWEPRTSRKREDEDDETFWRNVSEEMGKDSARFHSFHTPQSESMISSINITWELDPKADFQATSQTYWIIICIVTGFLGDLMHINVWEGLLQIQLIWENFFLQYILSFKIVSTSSTAICMLPWRE